MRRDNATVFGFGGGNNNTSNNATTATLGGFGPSPSTSLPHNNAPRPPLNTFSSRQARMSKIIQGVVAIPALLGAIYIIQHVLRSPKRRKQTTTRILLMMSCMDLLLTLFSLSGHWAAPKEIVPDAIGTWASCEAFGFFRQGALLSSILYHGSLTMSYLLTIRYGWRQSNFQNSNMEVFLHAFPMVAGWSTAIAGIPLELYNPTRTSCQIRSYPLRCGNDPGQRPCQRAPNAFFYNLAFFFVPLWVTFGFLVLAMSMIYRKLSLLDQANQVYHPERRFSTSKSQRDTVTSMAATRKMESAESGERQLQSNSSSIRSLVGSMAFRVGASSEFKATRTAATTETATNTLKRQFANQAMLYCAAFFLTWIFATVQSIVRRRTGQVKESLVNLQLAFGLLGGLWNALIYIRPRYLKHLKLKAKQEHEEEAKRLKREQQLQIQRLEQNEKVQKLHPPRPHQDLPRKADLPAPSSMFSRRCNALICAMSIDDNCELNEADDISMDDLTTWTTPKHLGGVATNEEAFEAPFPDILIRAEGIQHSSSDITASSMFSPRRNAMMMYAISVDANCELDEQDCLNIDELTTKMTHERLGGVMNNEKPFEVLFCDDIVIRGRDSSSVITA